MAGGIALADASFNDLGKCAPRAGRNDSVSCIIIQTRRSQARPSRTTAARPKTTEALTGEVKRIGPVASKVNERKRWGSCPEKMSSSVAARE